MRQRGGSRLVPTCWRVDDPGDFSSSGLPMVAALIVPVPRYRFKELASTRHVQDWRDLLVAMGAMVSAVRGPSLTDDGQSWASPAATCWCTEVPCAPQRLPGPDRGARSTNSRFLR